MTSADVDVVEFFCNVVLSSPGVAFFVAEVFHSDGEFFLVFIPENVVSDMAKFDPGLDARFLDTSLNVIFEDCTWRVRWDGLLEVFFKRVIGKFEALFWTVGPEISVHSGVYRLIVDIETSSPVVDPLSTE